MAILIPILILNIGAFSLSRLAKIESTVSYLIILMLSLDFIYFGALVDKLKPATLVCFAGMFVLFAIYMLKGGVNSLFKDIYKYCNIHMIFNFVSSVIYYRILVAKQPYLYYWDEIKIWGPSAKSVKMLDRLYSIGQNPVLHDRDYPAGNALMNYLFSFFSENYSEILLLTSYAVMFFAVFSAVSKLVEVKTKDRGLSVGIYLAFVLMPFLQNHTTIDMEGYNQISHAYGTAMVDFSVGVVFLAVLVLYFFDMDKYWYVLPAIYLVTVKKNGIFFALLAFCVIFCFELFVGRFNLKKKKKLIFTVVLGLLVPVLSYTAWGNHLDRYSQPAVQSGYNLEKTAARGSLVLKDMSFETAPLTDKVRQPKAMGFVANLTSARYKEILNEMKWYFAENQEIIKIKDRHLIVILFLMGLATAFLAEKKYTIALLLSSCGLTAACFVYNLCIAYQMQFYNDNMVEYPRYMLSYYYGWLYVMLVIALVFVVRKNLLKKLLILGLIAFSMWRINDIGLERTIIDAPDQLYYEFEQLENRLQPVNEILDEDDRVLLVWMDGYDIILYKYAYYLSPAICNNDTLGTGIDFTLNFRSPDIDAGDKTHFNRATTEDFADMLHKYFDYVYICDEYDWDFERSYGVLFDTPLAKDSLYAVTDNIIPLQKVVY